MPTSVNTIQKGYNSTTVTDSVITDSGTTVTFNLPQTVTDPASLPTCKFYWNATDFLTGAYGNPVLVSGANVTTAKDRINGWTLTGSSAGGYPIFMTESGSPNGLAFVRFNLNSGCQLLSNFLISSFSGLNGIWSATFVMRVTSFPGSLQFGGWYGSPDYVLASVPHQDVAYIISDIVYGGGMHEVQSVSDKPLTVPNTGFFVFTMYSDGTNVNIRINGYANTVNAPNPLPSITMSTSTPFGLGGIRNGSSVDMLAAVVCDHTLTLPNLQAYEYSLMNQFGYGQQQTVISGSGWNVERNPVVMSNKSVNTQQMNVDLNGGIQPPSTFTGIATLTVDGAIAAAGHWLEEHRLVSSGAGINVLSIHEDTGGGYSALVCRTPGLQTGNSFTGGVQILAIGTGPPSGGAGQFPFAAPNVSSGFIECYNDGGNEGMGTYQYPDFRQVMTGNGLSSIRHTINYETQALVDLDLTYTSEKAIGAAWTGVVAMRGRPVVATANNSVFSTQIPSTAYGIFEIKDTTNSKIAVFVLNGNTTIAATVFKDTEFTTSEGTSSSLNVYYDGVTNHQWVVENKLGSSANITAGLWGV